MKSKNQAQQAILTDSQHITRKDKPKNSPSDQNKINHMSELLASEGNESLNHYIEWLGLSRDPRLIVLSSVHHYYYDAEEMKSVRTVVNIKELNQIKEINSFLRSMFQILPPKCYFIGCFTDNKKQNGFSLRKRSSDNKSGTNPEAIKNGIISRIPLMNKIFGILDFKTNKYLSEKNVKVLLIKNGFNVADMTELDGLTYFCARSQRTGDN
jgi:hypothetical protein